MKESSENTAWTGKTTHAVYLCMNACMCICSSYRAISKPYKDLLWPQLVPALPTPEATCSWWAQFLQVLRAIFQWGSHWAYVQEFRGLIVSCFWEPDFCSDPGIKSMPSSVPPKPSLVSLAPVRIIHGSIREAEPLAQCMRCRVNYRVLTLRKHGNWSG